MKNKEIKLWFAGTVLVGLIACSQAVEAQNIVKVELDGTTSIKTLLGKSINEADSLVVSGKMTDEDFEAVRMASIYGQLTGLNIESVTFEDNRLPEGAFDGADPKVNMTTAKFRYITLPDNLVSLGAFAFQFCPELKNVNIPVTLKELGGYTFFECHEIFKGQCLEIPTDVTVIPSLCFCYCEGIGDVKFPDGLKRIENGAFVNCNFNNMILPENLEYIGPDAFLYVDYEQEAASERNNAIKGDIYCKAVNPPVCDDDNRGKWPFVADAEKTVYVPVGSAEAYREAPGWNQFTKFVEIEEFPTTGLTEVAMPDADSAVYDLQGNRVTAPVKGQIYISEGKKFVAR